MLVVEFGWFRKLEPNLRIVTVLGLFTQFLMFSDVLAALKLSQDAIRQPVTLK